MPNPLFGAKKVKIKEKKLELLGENCTLTCLNRKHEIKAHIKGDE